MSKCKFEVPALFRSEFDASSLETKFKSVGENSGNQVFTDSIRKIMGAHVCHFNDFVWKKEELPPIGNVVTTDMIWITENGNYDYILNQLSMIGDKSLVPISVGLQAKSLDVNFKLNQSSQTALKALSERAVLGVRGEYTASILEKHGITNYSVIGCPSLYYWNDENFQMKVPKKDKIERVMANFRTIYGTLTQKERHFLSYSANLNATFIEQTKFKLQQNNVDDPAYFNYVSKWLEQKTEIYFHTDEWLNAMNGYDFSFGGRFHGNIIALWKNIPALFLTVDSRTQEMINFFKLPHIKMDEFDKTKPIEYYYDLANFDNFNKIYKKNFNNFNQFLEKNGINLV